MQLTYFNIVSYSVLVPKKKKKKSCLYLKLSLNKFVEDIFFTNYNLLLKGNTRTHEKLDLFYPFGIEYINYI